MSYCQHELLPAFTQKKNDKRRGGYQPLPLASSVSETKMDESGKIVGETGGSLVITASNRPNALAAIPLKTGSRVTGLDFLYQAI